jgi:TonB family protein
MMMNMKTLVPLIIALMATSLYGQTAKDFYLPADGANKSNFFAPSPKTGGKTSLTSSTWFIKKGNMYDIKAAKFMNGEATSIQTQTIVFTSNEIKLLKTISTSILRETTVKTHTPPQTLLKLPATGQTASWTTKNSNTSTHKCTGELISANVRGQMRKVLKVKKEVIENGQLLDWATTFEYYAQGIGLWTVQFHTGEIMTLLENQEIDYDAAKLNVEQPTNAVVDEPLKKVVVADDENKVFIFTVVEEQPEFPGGDEAMMRFIKKNMRYPATARSQGVSGTAYVSFLVSKDGSISEAKTVRGIHADCDKEAMRVVSMMPPWRPGKENGKPVFVRFVLPIKFEM